MIRTVDPAPSDDTYLLPPGSFETTSPEGNSTAHDPASMLSDDHAITDPPVRALAAIPSAGVPSIVVVALEVGCGDGEIRGEDGPRPGFMRVETGRGGVVAGALPALPLPPALPWLPELPGAD